MVDEDDPVLVEEDLVAEAETDDETDDEVLVDEETLLEVELWEAEEDEEEAQPVRVLRYQLMGSSPRHSPMVTDWRFFAFK